MTYTPMQLEVIKTFGRKELTEGCYVIVDSVGKKYSDKPQKGRIAKYITDGKYLSKTQILTCNNRNRRFKSSWELREILGHIPHLEDVFRLARDRKMFYGIKGEYVKEKEFEYIEYIWFSNIDIGEKYIPYNPTLTLLDQPESVLIQILNLFK